jgi:hypothetical protein
MRFNQWLDTFLNEKGIDSEEVLEAEGSMGMNYIPVGSLVQTIKGANESNQKEIKSIMVKIDFANGSVRHFLLHLAKAIAI